MTQTTILTQCAPQKIPPIRKMNGNAEFSFFGFFNNADMIWKSGPPSLASHSVLILQSCRR